MKLPLTAYQITKGFSPFALTLGCCRLHGWPIRECMKMSMMGRYTRSTGTLLIGNMSDGCVAMWAKTFVLLSPHVPLIE